MSEPKGHSRGVRIAPDSFVYVRIIEQGSVVHWYGINASTDDRKHAQQKLQEDERDLRAIRQTSQAKESLQRGSIRLQLPRGIA